VPPPAYGGIEALVAGVVEGLVERGHDVTLIGVGGSKPAGSLVQTYDEPQFQLIGDELTAVVHAGEALEVVRYMRPDIVHDHTSAFALGAASLDTPVVMTVHGPADGEAGRYLAAVGSYVRLVSISHAQRATARALPWFGTVYNGLDLGDYPLSTRRGDAALFLGRMSPDKGAHLAIDVAQAAGRPIRLAGKCNEPAEQEYFAEQIEPRLGPDVEWLGELGNGDKQAALCAASCLLFPLQWDEPFGLVVVEALACGTPVLSLARGAIPELMSDGVTGFVREEPDELVPLFDKLGSIDPVACRRHVAERFTMRHTVLGYEQVYRDAVAAGRP
jgi:glycosyltransferase involved in cell wall biosynthesis